MALAVYHINGSNSIGPNLQLDFTADDGTSDAKAKTVGQSISTLLDCNVVVYKDGSAVPVGAYTPGSQGTTVSCPADVTLLHSI